MSCRYMRVYSAQAFIFAVFALAGCTQKTPAQVELKGHQVYAQGVVRGGATVHRPQASGYAAPTRPSVSEVTEQAAAVSSIGVSDIAPPKATASMTSTQSKAPFQLAPAAGKSTAASSPTKNPWTGKPRAVELIGADNEKESTKPGAASVTPSVPSVAQVSMKQDATPAKESATMGSKLTNASAVKKEGGDGFIWPVNSKKVVSSFGPKGKGKANDGVNIASANGEPVWAAADGEIVYAGNELAGYGNMVLIKHEGDRSTSYAHLSRIIVDKYERVKQGDIIGYVGSSGNAKSSQLHFAVRDGKTPVDPVKFMKQTVASLH